MLMPTDVNLMCCSLHVVQFVIALPTAVRALSAAGITCLSDTSDASALQNVHRRTASSRPSGLACVRLWQLKKGQVREAKGTGWTVQEESDCSGTQGQH